MKKQLSFIALAGAAFALAAPQVNAQALPGVYFNPDTYVAPGNDGHVANETGNTANVITVNGNIPEFIQFITVDNVLEMGNLGGPLQTGSVFSVLGPQGSTSANVVNQSGVGGGNGIAEITFDANTYVQTRLVAKSRLVNAGPDGIRQQDSNGRYIRPQFDNNEIGVNYRLALKGIYQRTMTADYDNGGLIPTTGYTTSAGYGAWTTTADEANGIAAVDGTPAKRSDAVLSFAPNGGAGGTGSNGFKVAARASRQGLNDYKGDYWGTIDLTYWKF